MSVSVGEKKPRCGFGPVRGSCLLVASTIYSCVRSGARTSG